MSTCRSPGRGTRTRAPSKTSGLLGTIVLGRAAPDRDRVDPRDRAARRAPPKTLLEEVRGTRSRAPSRAASLAKFAERRRSPPRSRQRSRARRARARRPAAARAASRSGSASQTSANIAGIEHERERSATSASSASVRQRSDEARSTRRSDGRAARRPRAAPAPRASVGRQLRPPGAERLEGVPEARLRGLLVERGVDVRDDERLDRGREALQLARGRVDRVGEREPEPFTKRARPRP